MSESFEKEVTAQLKEINVTLGEHSVALARIEQKELNGEKQEAKEDAAKARRLTFYRVLMGAGLFIIAVFTAINTFGWI